MVMSDVTVVFQRLPWCLLKRLPWFSLQRLPRLLFHGLNYVTLPTCTTSVAVIITILGYVHSRLYRIHSNNTSCLSFVNLICSWMLLL